MLYIFTLNFMVAMVTKYFLSRCILGCFPLPWNWWHCQSLYIFFFLSEIEYSANSDRRGMIHGWLFITLLHRLWCRVTLFTADVECFVFLLIKIQLILKKLSPKAGVWWMPLYSVTERKYIIPDYSKDVFWFDFIIKLFLILRIK